MIGKTWCALPLVALVSACGSTQGDAPLAGVEVLELQQSWNGDGWDYPTCEGGCTRTQGYYKNHYDGAPRPSQDIPWPLAGAEGNELCGQTWLEVLDTPPRGDKALILARQWIPARLNVASGACHPLGVIVALRVGDRILEDCMIDASEAHLADLALEWLEGYNEGRIGPGHCDDRDDDDDEISDD